ncbi:MAG: DUF2852 domain-containing protein [Bauldia sp.]
MVTSNALRPAWTPLTIALMIIGFIVFWPLGLLMLGYIMWGHRVPELKRHFEGAGDSMARDFRGCWGSRRSYSGNSRSGNFAFDDYREKELRRLDEERRRLDQERREFEAYVHDLRRARDKEEFDRFMTNRTARRADGEPKDGETIDL